MGLIFPSQPGAAAAVPTAGLVPAVVWFRSPLDNMGLESIGFACATQGGAIQYANGVGTSSTLTGASRFYLFGARPVDLQVSGYTLAAVCPDYGVGGSGLDRALLLYERLRANTRPLPVLVYFGPYAQFNGFMSGFQWSLADAASGVGQFAFQFSAAPRPAASVPIPGSLGYAYVG